MSVDDHPKKKQLGDLKPSDIVPGTLIIWNSNARKENNFEFIISRRRVINQDLNAVSLTVWGYNKRLEIDEWLCVFVDGKMWDEVICIVLPSGECFE